MHKHHTSRTPFNASEGVSLSSPNTSRGDIEWEKKIRLLSLRGHPSVAGPKIRVFREFFFYKTASNGA